MRNKQSTAEKAAPAASDGFSVGTSVNVTADDSTREGTIVEDFGVLPEATVDLGDGLQVSPKRFAVLLNDGSLVFVDEDSLEAIG
jgi:hypothetical protein